jgi:hypothetical protein
MRELMGSSRCAHAYLELDATCAVCGSSMAELEAERLERMLADEAERVALEAARDELEAERGPSAELERAWDARETTLGFEV